MAEARADEEEQALRESGGARRVSERAERNKPEQRNSSQGALSSIRAVIKRTSRTTAPAGDSRDRRRPEITILSAEPLASNSWFPGPSGAFPPAPPPPAQPSWGGGVLTVQLPPPSYEQVIREKTREQTVNTASVSSSSSSSSSSPAPRRATATIATQTDTEVSGPQTCTRPPVRRPPKPPRPSPPHVPAGANPAPAHASSLIELDDPDPPSSAHTPAHTHGSGVLSEQCGVQTDLSGFVGDVTPLNPAPALTDSSPSSHDSPAPCPMRERGSARPRPRPRSKAALPPTDNEDVLDQPMTREVKVQTLVRLKDDGTEGIFAGFLDTPSDVSSNKYLQELLDVFGYDERHCQQDESDQSQKSEDEEDPTSDNFFIPPAPSEPSEPLKRPEPMPRTQNPKPPITPKPSDPTQDGARTEPQSNDTNEETASAPVPAPRPLLNRPSLSPKQSSSQEDRLPPAPRPPVAARRSRVNTQAEAGTPAPLKLERPKEEDQANSTGSGPAAPAPAKPAPADAGSVKGRAGPTQTPVPSSSVKRPPLRRPPPPAHTSAQIPVSVTKAPACPAPSLPPRPSEGRLLPLRPPPIKLNKPPASSQVQQKSCRVPKRGPPLPPRPKPGHPLYRDDTSKRPVGSVKPNPPDPETQHADLQKEDLFVILDDAPTSAQTSAVTTEEVKGQGREKRDDIWSAGRDEAVSGQELQSEPKEERKRKPNSSVRYVARFAFEGEEEELTLQEGDVVTLLEYVNEEWGRGSLDRTGRTGLFPLNFLHIVQDSPQAPRKPTPQPFAPPVGEGQKGKALYDFTPESEDELCLKVGDVVHFLEEVNDEWFEGEFGGKRGIVPKNYIQVF